MSLEHLEGLLGTFVDSNEELLPFLGRVAKYLLPASAWNYSGRLDIPTPSGNKYLELILEEFAGTTRKIALGQGFLNRDIQRFAVGRTFEEILPGSSEDNALKNWVGYGGSSNPNKLRQRIAKICATFRAYSQRLKDYSPACEEAISTFEERLYEQFC